MCYRLTGTMESGLSRAYDLFFHADCLVCKQFAFSDDDFEPACWFLRRQAQPKEKSPLALRLRAKSNSKRVGGDRLTLTPDDPRVCFNLVMSLIPAVYIMPAWRAVWGSADMTWLKSGQVPASYHRCMHQLEQAMPLTDEHQVPPDPIPGDDPTPDQDPTPDEDPVPDHNPVADADDHRH